MNRREMLGACGGLLATTLLPSISNAKEEIVTWCPELIKEMEARKPIFEKWARSVRLIKDPVDAYNMACLLENNHLTMSTGIQFEGSFVRISHALTYRIYHQLSNFFNVWTMNGPEDYIYWQEGNKVIFDEKPCHANTRPVPMPAFEESFFDKINNTINFAIERQLKITNFCLTSIRNNCPKIKTTNYKVGISTARKRIKDTTGREATYLIMSPKNGKRFGFNEVDGIQCVGEWDGLKIWTHHAYPDYMCLAGHKSGPFSGGYTFAPYSSLPCKWVITDCDSFEKRYAIPHRFSHRMKNENLYCGVTWIV